MHDLNNFDTSGSSVAVLALRRPDNDTPLLDDEGKPVTISLICQDAEEFQALRRQVTNRRFTRMARSGGKAKFTAEELEGDALDLLVASTKAWSGIVVGKAVLECTPEHVRDVYERFKWIKEQVDEFTADRANFLKNRSTAS